MFLLTWLMWTVIILVAMTIDNFNWITSSPEWSKIRKRSYLGFLKYVWKDRVIPVWTDYRDIIPAIITGFMATLIWFGFYWQAAVVFVIVLKINLKIIYKNKERSWK